MEAFVDVLEVLDHLALYLPLELSPKVLIDELIELLSVDTHALQLLVLRQFFLDHFLRVFGWKRHLDPLLVSIERRGLIDTPNLGALGPLGSYRVLQQAGVIF